MQWSDFQSKSIKNHIFLDSPTILYWFLWNFCFSENYEIDELLHINLKNFWYPYYTKNSQHMHSRILFIASFIAVRAKNGTFAHAAQNKESTLRPGTTSLGSEECHRSPRALICLWFWTFVTLIRAVSSIHSTLVSKKKFICKFLYII